MANSQPGEEYKEKFRPEDTALDREVDAALGDLKIEELYAFDKPQPGGGEAGGPKGPGAESAGDSASIAQRAAKGMRHGKVTAIGKDEVFVDLGGMSQGICPILQF